MMKKYILLFIAAAGAATATAQQMQHTPQGIGYVIFSKGAADKAALDDIITFNIEQRTDKDSVLFSTFEMGRPVKTRLKPSQSPMDLMDIFVLMAPNDSAVVNIPVDSIFKGHEDQMPPFFTKGGQIRTYLKMIGVESIAKLKAAEAAAVSAYIAQNKLKTTTTPSGLKYIITKRATGPKPKNGDTLLVNYIGRTLQGKVFDSSIEAEAKKAGLVQPGRNYEPIEVVLGQGRVIKGWEEGLLLLGEGAKAKVLIPSGLAYGENGSGADIKPYSTLDFDIEVVKIKPAKVAVPAGTVN